MHRRKGLNRLGNYWIKLLAGFVLITALPIYWLAIELRSADSAPAPTADRGILDLREWRFDEDGAVRLNGQWDMYVGKVLGASELAAPSGSLRPLAAAVPGVWNGLPGLESGRGAATYRLRLLLPPDARGTFGIRMTNIRTASRIFVNGEQIGASGRPGETRSDTLPGNVPFAGYFTLTTSSADIVVQIANFSYASGGIVLPIWFGSQEAIQAERETGLFEYWLTAGGFLVPALFFLLFFRLRRREAPLLHIGAFCLCSLVYVLTHGEKHALALLPRISYDNVLRAQLISSNFIYYFLARYVVLLYPKYGVRLLDRAMAIIVVALTAIGIGVNPYYFSKGEPLLLIFSLLTMGYILYVLVRAIAARGPNTLSLAVSLQSVLFMLAVYLLHGFGRLESQTLLPYEIVAFVASQAHLLVGRFSDLLRHSQSMSERLLRLDEMKDDFMLNTAYQIREPLQTIRNMADTRRTPVGEGSSEKSGEEWSDMDVRLSSISLMSRRLSYLVDDLIDYSLLKSGAAAYNRDRVSLVSALRSVLETLPSGSHAVRMAVPSAGEPAIVEGDARRIAQVFYNLIDFALRRSYHNGVNLNIGVEGGRANLKIAAADIRSWWREDTDIDPTDAAETEETADALRLSVTRRLILLGGGSWRWTNAADAESELIVSWPVATVNSPPARDRQDKLSFGREMDASTSERYAAATTEPATASEEGAVLIACGDALGASVAAHLLEAEGISIARAISGERALALLESGRSFDLVVSDIALPDESGLSLTRKIRARYGLSQLPILILSEGRRPEDAATAFRAGANDIMAKPYDAEELKARVSTLLALRRSVRGLVRTETAFLQAQIKPHFLFNALNTIMTVCRMDPSQAEALLLELSRYLRASFDFDNLKQQVSLGKELELVRSYLAIEQARFGDRLRVVYEIDTGLSSGVPPLTIQPLVENAVRHGVMKKPEGGTVRISVKRDGDGCEVTVADDGIGIPAHTLATIGERRETGGVGLANIGMRLKLLYSADLHVESWPGEGSRVSFRIPGGGWNESDID